MQQTLIEIFERLGVRDVEVTDDVDKAVERITGIYEGAAERLRAGLRRFSQDGTAPGPTDAFYPFVGIALEASALSLDGRLAYGALHDPGDLRRHADPSAPVRRLLPHPARPFDPQPRRPGR